MDLADIGEKLANRARLTPQEMDFWKNSLRVTQLTNAFVSGLKNGESDINVRRIRARDFSTPTFGEAIRLGLNAATAIANDTSTTVLFDTLYYDDNNMWTSSDPGNINIKNTGKYQVSIRVLWAINGTGFRSFALNNATFGTVIALTFPPHSSQSEHLHVVEEVNLVSGRQYRLRVYQNSGADLNLTTVRMSLRLLRSSDNESE